jgi:hypothetical protein
MSETPKTPLPYPHARQDCQGCREYDAEIEILDGPGSRDYVRYCRDCIGERLLAAFPLDRDADRGGPWHVEYRILAPGSPDGSWPGHPRTT